MSFAKFPLIKTMRKVNSKDFNTLVNWLNGKLQFNIKGPGVSCRQGPDGTRIHITQTYDGDGVGTIRTAKTRAAGWSGGTTTVNLLDSGGDEIDNAVTVYIHVLKNSTSSTDGYWPTLSDDQEVMIMKDHEDDWILVRPDIQASESCTA